MTKRAPVRISKRSVDDLGPGDTIYDTEIRGFRAACLPSGRVTFGYQYSSPTGKGRPFLALGLYGEITADQARTFAAKAAVAVRDGRDPAAEKQMAGARTENTVNHVLDEWLEKYARGPEPMRSADGIEKQFKTHVRPEIGKLAIYDVTRKHITDMLNKVAAGAGPVAADRVLAYVRGAFNWWRIGDDKFITQPIVKGMTRTNPKKRQGKHQLDIEEIRDIWRALDEIGTEAPPCFPAFVRSLLLLATRRNELARMHVSEFGKGNKVNDWIIPAARYKTDIDHLLPLPEMIRSMLPDRKQGFIFSSDGGKTPFSGFSKAKAALDKAVDVLRQREGREPIRKWKFHDLRRTARSLMVSIGIADDHAKKVLGHVIIGIDSVYNVYDYKEEKFNALVKFATFIMNAVTPSPDNVVTFKKASAPRPPQRRHRAASVAG